MSAASEEQILKILGPGGWLSQGLSGYEDRSEQIQMAGGVWRAIHECHFLIVEAGTGTGKTIAYLLPAILSGCKIVISTGTKNLQEQLVYKDLPLLAEKFKFKTAVMKGRSNYLCWYRFRQFRQEPLFPYREDIEHFRIIVDWAKTTKSGDRAEVPGLPDDYSTWREISATADQCVGNKCPDFGACFVTRMRVLAQEADLIVVNHHLFLADLAVRMGGYGEVIPRVETVIFDEAHDLWETATDYFGYQISNWKIDELIRDIQREIGGAKLDQETLRQVDRHLNDLHSRGVDFFRSMERLTVSGRSRMPRGEEGQRFRLNPDMLTSQVKDDTEQVKSLLGTLKARLTELSRKQETMFNLAVRCGKINSELEFIMAQSDPDYVYWTELRGRGVFVHASPIMPGKILQEHLYKDLHAAVFTSATLAVSQGSHAGPRAAWSFDYFKTGLGLEQPDKPLEELRLPSGFDFSKQAILYLPDRMPEPDDRGFGRAVAEQITSLLDISQGRAFLLFTSFRNLAEVYDLIADRIPYTVLRQGDAPRGALLERFREDEHSVLFATSSFWQGVDVVGSALSCVIIDKLPFASPGDPITEARIQRINENGGNAFMDYQVPQAVISLRQGLGRLIRSRSDHGILAVLDSRIKTRRYGQLFLRSLPPMPRTSDLELVRHFFIETVRRSD